MGFDQFRTTLSSFERYYDRFLQNTFNQRTYRITLRSGDSAIGSPMAASIADPTNPDVAFNFRSLDKQLYRIPFRELQVADLLIESWLRTIDSRTTGGGDVRIWVPESDAQRVISTVEEASITSVTAFDINRVVATQPPPGHYKLLVIDEVDFPIRDIKHLPNHELKIEIER